MNTVFSFLSRLLEQEVSTRPARKSRPFHIFMILLLLFAFSNATTTQAASSSIDPSSTPTNPSSVFADDFESGNLLAWSGSVKDGKSLRVTGSAAYQGSYGLEARINDTHNIYVFSNTPDFYPPQNPRLGYTYIQQYAASFFFNPNSLKMRTGNEHTIFEGTSTNRKMGPAAVMFRLALRKQSGNYQLVAYALNGNTWFASAPYPIQNGWQQIKVVLNPYTGIGINPWGSLTLQIDGNEVARINRLGSTAAPSQIRLGAIAVDKGTSGRMLFDNFESWYSCTSSRLYW